MTSSSTQGPTQASVGEFTPQQSEALFLNAAREGDAVSKANKPGTSVCIYTMLSSDAPSCITPA